MDYNFFMNKALDQARKALAQGEFPVGCILVYEGGILTTGARSGTCGPFPNETEHAEMVALKKLAKIKTPLKKHEITLFCTMEPCLMCYGAILLSGIGKIVYAYEDAMGGGTGCDLESLPPLYRQNRLSIVPNILRHESLALFKAFFTSPANKYWQGSFLASYTLEQQER
ncbi:MAG: tRNA-specific adenosine deaminase [Desulfobacteraceae bacterium 4572_123]|nr:MAG: tRNA-specific adenosine deaminase [Desulfobacteraceae bacterium 4572_123]